MTEWKLPGPDKLKLTLGEVLTELDLKHESQLVRLIAEGRFPEGIVTAPGSDPTWEAEDVAAFRRMARRGCRVNQEKLAWLDARKEGRKRRKAREESSAEEEK